MSVPTINFLVDNVGASHMAFYLVENANAMSNDGTAHVTIFYDQLHRPCRKLLVPAMMMIEAWAQPGVSISTSLSTTARMLSFPGPQRKMFYVWDMSWMRNPKRVGPFSELFRNPDLTLIARCADHAKVLENNFNVNVPYVFDNFNNEALLRALENDNKTE
jgi:hypothetical protein